MMAAAALGMGYRTTGAVIGRLKSSLREDARYLRRRATDQRQTRDDRQRWEDAYVKALMIEVLRGRVQLAQGGDEEDDDDQEEEEQER